MKRTSQVTVRGRDQHGTERKAEFISRHEQKKVVMGGFL